MDLDELQKKLLRAGRKHQPNDQVPYAFEKRVMHAIRSLRPVDHWSFWGQALWRAVAPCAAVMLLLGIWTTLTVDPAYPGDLSDAMEATLLTPLDQQLEDVW